MRSLPVGFGGVNMGRRNDKVLQPRFGLGNHFDDTRLDRELMDAFLPLLDGHGGHLEKAAKPGDILGGKADANPDGTITVQAEMNLMENGRDGKHMHKSVFEAVVDRDGNPVRLKVAEDRGAVHDEATVLPDNEREDDRDKSHPLDGIKRMLDSPAAAVNAVIHAVDRVMQEMLPKPLN